MIGFRGFPEQRAELEHVLAEELRAPGRKGRRTLSKVTEYIVSLGLELYWARHELGPDVVDAWSLANGMDRRKALVELLRRGLEKKGKR